MRRRSQTFSTWRDCIAKQRSAQCVRHLTPRTAATANNIFCKMARAKKKKASCYGDYWGNTQCRRGEKKAGKKKGSSIFSRSFSLSWFVSASCEKVCLCMCFMRKTAKLYLDYVHDLFPFTCPNHLIPVRWNATYERMFSGGGR